MDNNVEDLHCFIDNQEVPLNECDLEHQSSNNADSIDSESNPIIQDVEQRNKIPKGALIVAITIKEGTIVEKVFKTTEGEKICLKGTDLKN